MRFARRALLISTVFAWLVPSFIAMWLHVHRFVHGSVTALPAYDYEFDPRFQRVVFLFRYGWVLALVLLLVLVVQTRLLRRLEGRSPPQGSGES